MKVVPSKKYGKLTAIEKSSKKINGRVSWICKCDCGNTIITEAYKLLRKNTPQKSCGCMQHVVGEQSTYNSWKSMRERCHQKTHHAYDLYGGRGIKVYKNWLGKNGYENFLKDLGPRPEGCSLERIDSDLGYYPKNCIWANAKSQAMSRRDRDDLRPTKMVQELIKYFGQDIQDENVIETPLRVIKSWKQEIFSGYNQDPKKILSSEFSSEKYDQIVLSKNIEIFSMCSHHLLPFFGKAHIGYIPKDKVVGISKLARLADCFSRRMQLQERLTDQIADAIDQELMPKGVMVIVQAQHMCMTMRGVGKQNSTMVTSAVRGVFKEDNSIKEEFLQLVRG